MTTSKIKDLEIVKTNKKNSTRLLGSLQIIGKDAKQATGDLVESVRKNTTSLFKKIDRTLN